ncbi:MAG: hypothetical protein HYV27_10495 [Candidatus Hydrogenedentes bacterium]|nr:hypothetical protein [Candidatus Hydrogenedentota bacterium]
MDDLILPLELGLMTPYLAWGIYNLIRRYRYHEEPSLLNESLSLAAVVIFIAIQFVLLREVMQEQVVLFLFAFLGLFVSASALYGPMAISATSRVVIGFVMPSDEKRADEPRFGPADSLMKAGNYEEACQELLVLARIFPRHYKTHLRVGECYLKLEQPLEALTWFERALRVIHDEETWMTVAGRLADLYQSLGRKDDARRVLHSHRQRFKQSSSDSAIQRLRRIDEPALPVRAAGLEALEEHAIEDTPETDAAPAPLQPERRRKPRQKPSVRKLVPLEDAPAANPDEDLALPDAPILPVLDTTMLAAGLAPLDAAPPETGEAKPSGNPPHPAHEPLSLAPLESGLEENGEPEEDRPRGVTRVNIALTPMNDAEDEPDQEKVAPGQR